MWSEVDPTLIKSNGCSLSQTKQKGIKTDAFSKL